MLTTIILSSVTIYRYFMSFDDRKQVSSMCTVYSTIHAYYTFMATMSASSSLLAYGPFPHDCPSARKEQS